MSDLGQWAIRNWRIWAAIGIGVVSVVVGATVSLPMVPVPMTLQSLAIIVIGGLCGPLWGVAILALYLGLGALGLPVFASGGSGVEAFSSSGAGYLWSFPLAAAVAGVSERLARQAEHPLPWLTAGFVFAHLVILGLGVFVLAETLVLREAFAVGARPFLLGAVIKSLIGAAIVTRIGWRMPALSR